jgi:tetratricopeptide (TPR) repeat protein
MARRTKQKTSTAAGLALSLALACSGGSKPAESPDTPPPLDDDTPSAAPAEGAAKASSPKVQEGMDAIQAGEFEKAKAVLEEAVMADASDAQAVFYLGVAQQSLGDAQAAISSYEKALELDPKLGEARVNLSAALLDAGEADRALGVIDEALKSKPDDAALLLNRAMALGMKGDAKAAAQAFEKAAQANAGDPEVQYLYAEALVKAGDAAKAEAELSKLTSSEDVAVLASAARLLGKLGKFDGCIAALDRAIAKKPVAELHVQRGLCKHGKKDNAGALADYEAAVSTDPKYAAGYFYLGQHKRAVGDRKGAKAALQKAVELDPNGGVGKAAKKALATL